MHIAPNAEMLVSIEEEWLTATPRQPEQVVRALPELLRMVARRVPSLPGPSGIMTGYGRLYPDAMHLEMALPEAHSPYVLALIADRQRRVVAAARQRLADLGMDVLLANNNHSGLLQRGAPVWGSHENYLVEAPPESFTALILPFLVSRLYAGAGGIEYPYGRFLAGVRPLSMNHVEGGDTTSQRAIHGTCRNEPHLGSSPTRFRYHGILADGHRSQFNLALQLGATALALKAIIFDPRLPRELERVHAFRNGNWLDALNRLNVLQTPGGPLQIDPVVITTQRIYLDAAHRFADSLDAVPVWVPNILHDWDATLTAYERLDLSWLAERFDAFAKYRFWTSVLGEEGTDWQSLPRRPQLFSELALLDHSYHNFAAPDSVFRLLEQQGLLQHRVGPTIAPGEEAEPFVPETSTRASARARFIREHAGQDQFVVDWSCVVDRQSNRIARLDEPFAGEFSPWEPFEVSNQIDVASLRYRHLLELMRGLQDRSAIRW